jgi:chromosome partitioning protein
MIILLAATKGGAGKSTLATSIAALLAGQGADVVLVDADRQATASTWAARREADSSLPRVACFQPPSDNIRQMLLDLDKRYSHVVVDCAGHDSKELRTGLSAAHVSLSPFRPSQPDLDTAAKLGEMVSDARDSLNPGLRSFAVLTLCPTNPAITEIQDAQDYLADVNGMTAIKPCIHDRKAYRDAICDGKGVTEQPNDKASAEVVAVWEAINGQV